MRRDERLAWTVGHWRMAVPLLLTAVATLLMTVPLVSASPLLPHLPLLFVLVWTVFQPSLMPAWGALVIGILADAVLGLPIGVNAALLPLLVIGMTALEARFGARPFELEWLFGTGVILVYQLLTWSLVRFVLGDGGFWPLFVQGAITAAAYPLVVAYVARVQRRWDGFR
jgi:rod shape-determining protein MreD